MNVVNQLLIQKYSPCIKQKVDSLDQNDSFQTSKNCNLPIYGILIGYSNISAVCIHLRAERRKSGS